MLLRPRVLVTALASAAVLAAGALTGCTQTGVGGPSTGGSGASTSPEGDPTAAGDARAQLARLAVAPWHSMRGYSRARFPHWIEADGNCNTREFVLRRQGQGVRTSASCHATAGRWISPYDGKAVRAATSLDVDHVVPLANAWRSGADRWTDAARRRFANDLRAPQLIAVTASLNRSKGDQGPEAWKPPSVSYWCTYARNWIAVKYTYRLTVTRAEHDALAAMLGRC